MTIDLYKQPSLKARVELYCCRLITCEQLLQYFATCLLCVQVPLMDIAGRRILLLVPMLAMIIDLAVLTACLLTQVLPPLIRPSCK